MMDLLQLAERCEAATGPDSELDAQIIIALEHPDYRFPEPVLNRKPDRWTEAAGRLRHDGFGGERPWPKYTASIDAALTLVPDGWSFSLGEMMGLPEQYRWRCHLRDHREPYNPSTCKWVDRDCRTPALAICAAALRARASEQNNG